MKNLVFLILLVFIIAALSSRTNRHDLRRVKYQEAANVNNPTYQPADAEGRD